MKKALFVVVSKEAKMYPTTQKLVGVLHVAAVTQTVAKNQEETVQTWAIDNTPRVCTLRRLH